MSSLFNLNGWEMIYNSIRNDTHKNADSIIAFVHWFLVHKANMGCLGTGNDVRVDILSGPVFMTNLTHTHFESADESPYL